MRPATPTTPAARRLVFRTLLATSGLALIAEGVANVNLMPYAAGLGLPAAGLGLIFAAHRLARLVVAPGVGVAAERFGRRRPFLAGLACVSAALAVLAFAGNLVTLLAARALYGLASALIVTAGQASVLDLWGPRDRASALGLYHAALYGVYPLGSLVGGFLVDSLGHRPTFVLLSVVVLGATAVGYLLVTETREGGAGAAGTATGIGLADYPRLLRGPVLRYTALKMVSGFAIWGVFEATFVLFLLTLFGPQTVLFGAPLGTRSLAGILLAIVLSVGFLVGSPVVGRWSDRSGRRLSPVVASFALTSLAFVAMAATRSPEGMAVAAVVLGLAVALVSAPLAALVGDSAPAEARAAVMAAYATLNDLANAAGAILGALATLHAGYRTTYLGTAVLVLVGAVALLAPGRPARG